MHVCKIWDNLIWPRIRFDISLQNFKKPLDSFSPQIERKRSKEHLVIILAVDHRSQGGLENSQSHSANVFRVDDRRWEPRVLHEMTQNKLGKEESDFAIPFVDENDYSEISAKAVSAKPKLKKNRPSSLV